MFSFEILTYYKEHPVDLSFKICVVWWRFIEKIDLSFKIYVVWLLKKWPKY